MKYYEYSVIRDVVTRVVDGDPTLLNHPNDDSLLLARTNRDKQIDYLVQLISTITDTCYSAGRLEVQQGIIRALDLRHLLGLH